MARARGRNREGERERKEVRRAEAKVPAWGALKKFLSTPTTQSLQGRGQKGQHGPA